MHQCVKCFVQSDSVELGSGLQVTRAPRVSKMRKGAKKLEVCLLVRVECELVGYGKYGDC